MPINKDRFEKLEEDSPTPGTNAAMILESLRANPDKAFTQSEIVAETDVKQGSIGPTLVRLRGRGRVDHRGNYWRVSDHEETVTAATGHAASAVASREQGEDEIPQMGDLQEHAVDPREHRHDQ